MLFTTINLSFISGVSLLLGVAMLAGKWRSNAAAEARDPDRARYVEGVFLVLIGALLGIEAVLFVVLPEQRSLAMAPWYSAGMIVVVGLGLIPLFRARRR